MVLLTGETDKNLLKELTCFIKELNEKAGASFGFFSQEDAKIMLIEK
jgi:hypothetical protein